MRIQRREEMEMSKALTGKQVGAIFESLPGTRAELAVKLGVSPNTMTNWSKHGVTERDRLALVKIVEEHEREQRLLNAAVADFRARSDDWLVRLYAHACRAPGDPGQTGSVRLYQELHALWRASAFYLLEHTGEHDYDAFALALFEHLEALAHVQRAHDVEDATSQGAKTPTSARAFVFIANAQFISRIDYALSVSKSSLHDALCMGLLAYGGRLSKALMDGTLLPDHAIEGLEGFALDYALMRVDEQTGELVPARVGIVLTDPYTPVFARQADAIAHEALRQEGWTLLEIERHALTDSLPGAIATLTAALDELGV